MVSRADAGISNVDVYFRVCNPLSFWAQRSQFFDTHSLQKVPMPSTQDRQRSMWQYTVYNVHDTR